MLEQKVLFKRGAIDTGPEKCLIRSCLAELRRDGSDSKQPE